MLGISKCNQSPNQQPLRLTQRDATRRHVYGLQAHSHWRKCGGLQGRATGAFLNVVNCWNPQGEFEMSNSKIQETGR